ncbi:CAP domain-containing protein [Thermobifida halotolerans]|uniref:CAP domain-containing protein n=1 Tax=Thermobifida halotolerans TaxID=483545 RepID=A0A399G2N0_9ACTN|nr:CAP domain-containing protein [Thermobifida halotolerans]UOE19943.1 CAP domain-containing protein [Thermobifida halotolerans]
MSEDDQPSRGSRSHRRRRRTRSRARKVSRPRRRWRGPLLAALLSVPVGLGLAAVLVFGSVAWPGGDPIAYAPDSLLPDDASVPTPFFPSPEPGQSAAPPAPSLSPAGEATQQLGGVETRAEESDSGGGSSSGGGGGSGGGSGGSGGGSGGGSSSGGGGGSTGSMNTLSAQVFDLVNEERADAGCPPVHADERLTAAAQLHSEDMDRNNYISHTSLDGRSPADRADAQGYHAWSGENVAKGQRTAEQVMDDWMNSPGHRRNILNCGNRALGVGESNGAWTQMFGRE